MAEELYHWHFDAHVSTRAQLHYVFAQVGHRYKRQTLFAALVDDFFSEHGITSFGIYEIYGQWDIILKAWVPLEHIADFQEKLKAWSAKQELNQAPALSQSSFHEKQLSLPLANWRKANSTGTYSLERHAGICAF